MMTTNSNMKDVMIETKKKEDAKRMGSPLPRKVEVAATKNATATFTTTVCNKNGEKKNKRQRRFNPHLRNIPDDQAVCISLSGNKEDGRKDYLPTLEEAQRRADMVHRLQQQIRNLEKELAMKLKEEKAKNDASSSVAGRKRTACQYTLC